MAGLIDQLELTVTVTPALTDQVRLDATVCSDHLTDAIVLQIDVSPRVTDTVLLAVTVQNQALEAAAQSALLAPMVEVTWLS